MGKMIALIKKLYYDKRMRFLFVGGLNTAVGYGTFALFVFFGIHYSLATALSTIIGVIHSYFWHKYFTFTQKKKSGKEVVKFISVYLVSYGLTTLLQYIMIDLNGFDKYLAGFISLIITTLLSYFGHTFFSFRQLKRKSMEAESNCNAYESNQNDNFNNRQR